MSKLFTGSVRTRHSEVSFSTCAPSQQGICLLIQSDHMLCHFSAAIGHVSPQCHPCELEIDLNGFPSPSRRPCAAVCMCWYLSIYKALTSCPANHARPHSLLISAPTAQRPGRGLNEPLFSAGRQSCFFSFRF